MDTNIPALSEYLRRRRALMGLSTADVQRISRRKGSLGISAGYVSLIETGQVKDPSLAKLAVLARVYGLTNAEVFAVATGGEVTAAQITEERLVRVNLGYTGMPEEKKKQLDPLIDLLARECNRLQDNGI